MAGARPKVVSVSTYTPSVTPRPGEAGSPYRVVAQYDPSATKQAPASTEKGVKVDGASVKPQPNSHLSDGSWLASIKRLFHA